jgi:hypothetical protein
MSRAVIPTVEGETVIAQFEHESLDRRRVVYVAARIQADASWLVIGAAVHQGPHEQTLWRLPAWGEPFVHALRDAASTSGPITIRAPNRPRIGIYVPRAGVKQIADAVATVVLREKERTARAA